MPASRVRSWAHDWRMFAHCATTCLFPLEFLAPKAHHMFFVCFLFKCDSHNSKLFRTCCASVLHTRKTLRRNSASNKNVAPQFHEQNESGSPALLRQKYGTSVSRTKLKKHPSSTKTKTWHFSSANKLKIGTHLWHAFVQVFFLVFPKTSKEMNCTLQFCGVLAFWDVYHTQQKTKLLQRKKRIRRTRSY